ncbi:SprT-like family-domain-containing protein [Roridomyces roridus]|uniref:SprT-like family-domain-containing protein n=1 Tax=Roridomyces roridus TaxID=1738132 RepID=A0AAD7BTV8_9AGAR|nr:SprT-like family-domain-containing protein [Roridomyces roridus]
MTTPARLDSGMTPAATATAKSAPTRHEPLAARKPRQIGPTASWNEIIPDSEEERVRERERDAIEISSDSDEERPRPASRDVPGALLEKAPRKKFLIPRTPVATPTKNATPKKHGTPSPTKPTRRIVKDIVEDSDVEVLGDPAPTASPAPRKNVKDTRALKGKRRAATPTTDGTISDPETVSPAPSSDSDDPFALKDKYSKYWIAPNPPKIHSQRSIDKFNRLSPREQDEVIGYNKLVTYAEQVYSYLNHVVFRNMLPPLDGVRMKLVWNKRLLTTAGRAKYLRNEGIEDIEIHLATKVLISEDRVRNTLSHEMCHLASWMIDKELKESHGKIFKRWAYRVEQKDSNIEVSVRHSYELFYPFEWKCVKCEAVVGRYTNSLNPEVTRCGNSECRGRLNPLFDPPPAKKKARTGEVTSRISKHAKTPASSASSITTTPSKSRSSSPIKNRTPEFIDLTCISDEEDFDAAVASVQEDDSDVEIVEYTPAEREELRVFVMEPATPSKKTEAVDSITDLARRFEKGLTITHRVCSQLRTVGKHRPRGKQA